MAEEDLVAVKIDRERLWKDLHSTCEWGEGERWESKYRFFFDFGTFLYH